MYEQLLHTLQFESDAASADAVRVFTGDINAANNIGLRPLVVAVDLRKLETISAFGRRGDVNPNIPLFEFGDSGF